MFRKLLGLAVVTSFAGLGVVSAQRPSSSEEPEEPPKAQVGLESLEEVQKLLSKLPSREREVVRLYYLEGRTYEEISTELHIPVNNIGPILSRAKKRLRKDVKNAAHPRPVRPQAENQAKES